MIVILKSGSNQEKVDTLLAGFRELGLTCHLSNGDRTTIVGLVGDTSKVDIDSIRANDLVEDVKRVSEPYKAANRKFHPEDTVVEVGKAKIGGGFFSVIAGPCSVGRCSAAAPLSRAPRPMRFRDCTAAGWSCCCSPKKRPDCRLSLRL